MRQFVGVILINNDGEVLAQHRDNKPTITGPDTWCVVGGAADEGEDLKQAGARELLEESEYVIDPNELDLLVEDEYTSEKGIDIHRTIYWSRYDGKQKINTREGQEIRFIKREEFGSLKFYTGHEGFLRKALDLTVSHNPETL